MDFPLLYFFSYPITLESTFLIPGLVLYLGEQNAVEGKPRRAQDGFTLPEWPWESSCSTACPDGSGLACFSRPMYLHKVKNLDHDLSLLLTEVQSCALRCSQELLA